MIEVFINIDELNDEDLAITITDEEGIFIDELGDDLLSVSLDELEKKVEDLGYFLTYEDKEDITYFIDSYKEYLYLKNNNYAYNGCYYIDDGDIKLTDRVGNKTFRGFIRKRL